MRIGSLSERILLHRLRRGDPAAAEQFVAERYERIYRLLQHLTGSPDAADDLAQQTFLRAWQALPDFRAQSALTTWLYRIAYREYTQWLRSRNETAADSSDSRELSDKSRPGDMAEGLALRDAIETLAPEQREAFLLYHIQGLSVREIATIVNAPAGTIKYRLFAARHHLRKELSDPESPVDTFAPVAIPAASSSSSCDTRSGVMP